MTVISPSILASNFLQLGNEIKRLNKEKDIWVHLDIMDGHFVPNLTFGHEVIEKVCKISTNPIDVHLMVNNPSFYIDTLSNLGIHNITWHLENDVDHVKLYEEAKKSFKSVGISIKPKTEIKKINQEILRRIDLILVMSVEPGFGGQSFINNTYDRVSYFEQLKLKHGYNYTIQVDGGINDKNSPELIKRGAQNLVAGSFVFKDDVSLQIQKLLSKQNGSTL